MSDNKVIVHKGRTCTLSVDLGINITGDTITSQIRTEPNVASPLLAEWDVTVDVAATGKLTLVLDDTETASVSVTTGYMDIKRVVAGDAVPVFDEPLEVTFRGVVTE